MATDNIIEFFVKRTKGKKSTLTFVGICLGVALVLVGLTFLIMLTGSSFVGISMLAGLVAIIAAVYFIRRLNLEFEYSFFGGELTIDKIYNQTKRASLVEFALKNVEEFGLYQPGKTNAPGFKIICTPDEEAVNAIYLKIPSNMIKAGKYVSLNEGFTYVILENSERVHSAIKTGMRPSVYREGIKQF